VNAERHQLQRIGFRASTSSSYAMLIAGDQLSRSRLDADQSATAMR
jgi:hypothetical protein